MFSTFFMFSLQFFSVSCVFGKQLWKWQTCFWCRSSRIFRGWGLLVDDSSIFQTKIGRRKSSNWRRCHSCVCGYWKIFGKTFKRILFNIFLLITWLDTCTNSKPPKRMSNQLSTPRFTLPTGYLVHTALDYHVKRTYLMCLLEKSWGSYMPEMNVWQFLLISLPIILRQSKKEKSWHTYSCHVLTDQKFPFFLVLAWSFMKAEVACCKLDPCGDLSWPGLSGVVGTSIGTIQWGSSTLRPECILA